MNINKIFNITGADAQELGYKRIIYPFVDDNFNKDYFKTGKTPDYEVAVGIKRNGEAILINYFTGQRIFPNRICDLLKGLKIFELFRINYDVEEFTKDWKNKTIEAIKELRKHPKKEEAVRDPLLVSLN